MFSWSATDGAKIESRKTPKPFGSRGRPWMEDSLVRAQGGYTLCHIADELEDGADFF
jgi:hypothetical protein